jgi:hypothetical protein
MGLERQAFKAMDEGKEAHRIIQQHVSGKLLDTRLEKITVRFPVVEERDFDTRTHFKKGIDGLYAIHGYLDGIDPENKRFLEIKTGFIPWGIAKFHSLMQWRLYSLLGEFNEAVFITCTRDLKKVAMFKLDITEKHKQEALDWIKKGIAIIESGEFSYTGQGKSRYCLYINCPFCGQ